MLHTYDRDQPAKAIRNASVDRIDSNGCYTPDNVQLVCVRVNLMKGPLDQSVFFALSRLVGNFEPYYKQAGQ